MLTIPRVRNLLTLTAACFLLLFLVACAPTVGDASIPASERPTLYFLSSPT